MWIGCCQPPELFSRIHRSAEFRFTVKRISSQSMKRPLTCHWPLPRSKRNRRVIRGVDRGGQEVAVVGDGEVRNRLLRVVRIGEEQLVEARRTAVEDPEAVAAFLHLEERLEDAVDEQLVADQAVEPEEVEADLPRAGVD